jgi:hypothetical protein
MIKTIFYFYTKTVLAALTGVILGVIVYVVFIVVPYNKCKEAEVVIKSFDVCLEVPGCFFDADHVLRAGKALKYKQENCPN